jgi:hypothetical protein
VSPRKSDNRAAKLKALVVSLRIAVTNTDCGTNESRYGVGYWDAFRQAADELEAVLDGREIPPANRDLPAK